MNFYRSESKKPKKSKKSKNCFTGTEKDPNPYYCRFIERAFIIGNIRKTKHKTVIFNNASNVLCKGKGKNMSKNSPSYLCWIADSLHLLDWIISFHILYQKSLGFALFFCSAYVVKTVGKVFTPRRGKLVAQFQIWNSFYIQLQELKLFWDNHSLLLIILLHKPLACNQHIIFKLVYHTTVTCLKKKLLSINSPKSVVVKHRNDREFLPLAR